MANQTRTTISQSNVKPSNYWIVAKSPLACVVFLFPFLLIYELGLWWSFASDPGQIQNGADYWMRACLAASGYEITWLLPVIVVSLLLGWHITSKLPWQIDVETVIGMYAESLLYALLLVLIADFQSDLFALRIGVASSSMPVCSISPAMERVISFFGAGLYEEMLFRLLALPLGFAILKAMQLSEHMSLIGAVIWTSVLFSLAHFWGPAGDQFTWFSFVFRMIAGLFFSSLFVLRGFGITVGTHTAYDIIVGVILASS